MAVQFAAETIILGRIHGSEAFEIHLGIGAPVQVSEHEWACSVSMAGLHTIQSQIHGMDSWQALQLANHSLRNLASGFLEQGGELFWPDDPSSRITLDMLWPGAQAS